MPQFLVIGAVLGAALTALWWIGRIMAGHQRTKSTAVLQRENADLRKVISDMSMEKHHSHEQTRGRDRR
jgi:hypothetical protein